MPHITFPLADLEALSGRSNLDLDAVEGLCMLVKGELKRKHSDGVEVKVELQDTNRPDTWTVEGIARQARQHERGEPGDYGFFDDAADPAGAIEVDSSVEGVRPFVAGFLAEGYTVDDAGLKAFISAQEVLCRNFGRKRKSVAIGIYDAGSLQFPVRYEVVDADSSEHAFRPLPPAVLDEAQDAAGEPLSPARWAEAWTPAEILRDHPTGRQYANAIAVAGKAPLLSDAKGEVLSFPPIINSAALGRVQPGMSELFVEVTGTTLDQVLLATNILAANLADRGATIRPVITRYPFDTPRGREVRAPHPLEDRRAVTVGLDRFRALLGAPELSQEQIVTGLQRFGLSVRVSGDELEVSSLPYRADYLHAVDAIEDFVISAGLDSFTPLMPQEFTVGSLGGGTRFEDVVRDRMIGVGFEEAIGNLLTSVDEVRTKCQLPAEGCDQTPLSRGRLVRITNVMNLNYSVLRDLLLPTLLEVERHSSGAVYPHRVFEVGEVCQWDAEQNLKSKSKTHLGALVADHEVGFSETQAFLHAFFSTLGVAFADEGCGYRFVDAEHPSFIPGRSAWIEVEREGVRERVGLLGEVHPAVLDAWKIYFPVGAFELDLERLARVVEG